MFSQSSYCGLSPTSNMNLWTVPRKWFDSKEPVTDARLCPSYTTETKLKSALFIVFCALKNINILWSSTEIKNFNCQML